MIGDIYHIRHQKIVLCSDTISRRETLRIVSDSTGNFDNRCTLKWRISASNVLLVTANQVQKSLPVGRRRMQYHGRTSLQIVKSSSLLWHAVWFGQCLSFSHQVYQPFHHIFAASHGHRLPCCLYSFKGKSKTFCIVLFGTQKVLQFSKYQPKYSFL